MAERVEGFGRPQIDDAFLVILDSLLGISQFLIAECDVVVAEAEAGLVHLEELGIGEFELCDGLLELNVVHEEVALEVVEVGVEDGVGLDDVADVLQRLVVLVLLLENADH
jgi:hypothetical protein